MDTLLSATNPVTGAATTAPSEEFTMGDAELMSLASSIFPGRSISPQDLNFIRQNEKYKARHRGHEGRHLAMFLIFVIAMALLPTTVRYWRRLHPKSYRWVSIGSICIIPPYFALGSGYYRFIVVWLVYAIANVYVLYKATRVPLSPRTPRGVYQWFALINKATYVLSALGFFVFLTCFFNVVPGLTDTKMYAETSMMIVFYGLYFGLVSRDLVSLCTEKIAATLGYSSTKGLPTKYLPEGVCCVCGAGLGESSSDAANADYNNSNGGGLLSSGVDHPIVHVEIIKEPTYKLECGHVFHASCIRGWCVIGKRDVCPFCYEKVDLKLFKQNPWDKQEVFYVAALEYMRFFVSWQPLTLLFLATIYWILGLD